MLGVLNKHDLYILSNLKAGDKDAFTLIFNEYFPKVKMFIKKMIGSSHVSEEFAQEVFVRLWINHSKVSLEQPISSYLFAISKNIVIDYFRKLESERKYVKHIIDNDDGLVDDAQSQMFYTQIEEIIKQAVENMPAKQKMVFKLSREESLKNKEIAERMRLSKRTVDKHITNALKMIKENLNSNEESI